MGNRSRNQDEKDFHERLRATGCVCCGMAERFGFKRVPLSPPFLYVEINHHVECSQRLGHKRADPECSWHHRAVAPLGMTLRQATFMFGPSRAGGSKLFHKMYGNDESLQSIAESKMRDLHDYID